jgi:hypothetical protein
METLVIYVNNVQDVFSALDHKIKSRKWKCTNLRISSDGSIRITCQDQFVSCQVETFLDMIVSDEYQITVE